MVAQLFCRRRGDVPLERLTRGVSRSSGGIAETLVLTVDTVEKHVQSILSKLDLPQSSSDHRRVLAVLAHLQPGE